MADSSHNSNRGTDEHERIIGIPESDEDSIINEWVECLFPQQSCKSENRRKYTRKHRIKKVPPTLREDTHNTQEYDPVAVSFGPYHHKKDKLQAAEKLKIISLQIYVSKCGGKTTGDLSDKILEVVGDAKSCYVAGSTDAYNDEEFSQMMLLDGCLILNLIEWIVRPNLKVLLIYEHLGVLGFSNLYRDMFLLENQVPYRVLQVLMSIRFDREQEREEIINTFFNFILFGQWFQSKNLKVTIGEDDKQQPLHLLEILRTSFPSKSGNANSIKGPELESFDKVDVKKYIHSFRSVRELKAKGIWFRPSSSKFMTEIKFKSHYLYGHLEIPPMVIDEHTKSTLLNLIAYEMCPNNPNDFRVTAYVRFMKSLIDHPHDVKELRTNNILLNYIGRADDEVVKMFKEIITPPVNVWVFNKVEKSIQEHYNSKTKTWIAELISQHFGSPWTTIALLAAFFLLVLTFIQTLFTVHPKSK